MKTPLEFINAIGVQCQIACKDTHIFPSVCIAQAALETGWGKSAIGNNIFGIKANTAWKGKKQVIKTTEILHAQGLEHLFSHVYSVTPQGTGTWLYVVDDWFRDYDTIADSIKDHNLFLKVNTRYAKAGVFTSKTPEEQIQHIVEGGYATGAGYANIIISIIHGYGLKKFDNATV